MRNTNGKLLLTFVIYMLLVPVWGVAESSTEIDEGLQTFTLEKSPEELEEQAKRLAPSLPSELLPSVWQKQDKLRLTTGLGWMEGEMIQEFSATGRFLGGDTDFSTIFSLTSHGAALEYSHLGWLDDAGGHSIEGGDLNSDIWGRVRGARYGWKLGEERWAHLGLYVNGDNVGNAASVLTYSDALDLTPQLRLVGEVATDGAYYAALGYKGERLNLYSYRRDTHSQSGHNYGFYGSYNLFDEVYLYYNRNETRPRQETPGRSERWAVRFPVTKKIPIVLERAESTYDDSRHTTHSVMTALPLGDLRLLLRYQDSSWESHRFAGTLITGDYQSVVSSLSYSPDPRLYFNYQVDMQKQYDRTVSQERLLTTYQPSSRLSLSAQTGFPDVADDRLLRLQLQYKMKPDLNLLVEYGYVAPYQDRPGHDYSGRGFKFMLQKTFHFSTPAVGTTILGKVTDQAGHGVAGIKVKVDNYAAVTDEQGDYRFEGLPSGNYEVQVDKASVPTFYEVQTAPLPIQVSRRKTIQADFRLVPLSTISGRVYCDANGNGEYDQGEGIEGAVIHVDGRVTAADRDGTYGFYNLVPGPYVVGFDIERMPGDYELTSPRVVPVHLDPDKPVLGVDFTLVKKERPIIFQELP